MPDWVVGLSTGCCCQSNICESLDDIRTAGFWRIEVCSHPRHLDYHNLELV